MKAAAVIAALSAALVTALEAGAQEPDGDTAGEFVAASQVALSDHQRYEAEQNAHLAAAADNDVTCRLRSGPQRAVPQLDYDLGVLKAQEAGQATAVCLSLNSNYTVVVEAVMQYFDASPQVADFVDIPDTQQQCSVTSSVAPGVPTLSNCLARYSYPTYHYSVGKLHRTCFRLFGTNGAPTLQDCGPAPYPT